MKIGIRTGCLKTTWTDGLKLAAELGFDSLEPNVTDDWNACPLANAEQCAQLTKYIQETGCAIDSICVGGLWKNSPASADTEVRAHARELMTLTARLSPKLGVKWILVPITPGGEDVDYETSVQRWIDMVTELAPVARENGVTFCLENVGRGCGRSADELIRLVDAVDSPAVQAYYDIGNAVLFGFDPVDEIQQLGTRIRIVHIKDHADLLGEGDVPIAASLKALRNMDYDDSLIFETTPTNDPARAATYNLAFVKGILSALA